MNILTIAPSLQLGGLENSVSSAINLLVDRGHRVSLATCYRHEHFYKLDENIEVMEPKFEHQNSLRVLFYARWMHFIRRCVRIARPDVVLSYGDFHNALVLTSLRGTGLPVVVSDRASPGLEFPFPLRVLRNWSYRHAAGIVAQTRRAAEVKREMTSDRVPIVVIPNAIRQLRQHAEIGRRRTILAVARHYPVKGLDRLLMAFSHSGLKDWTLEIAGSKGPDTPKLKEMIRDLGLSKRVTFLGSIKDLSPIYSRAGIFVLPSRSEGFPNALIEAMAHGVPSVSFDIDAGPADIIRDGENGILIPDDDIPGLAKVLQELAASESRRRQLGHNAKSINRELDPGKIGDQLSAFLQQAAGLSSGQAGTSPGGEGP